MGRPLKKDIYGKVITGVVTEESGMAIEGFFGGALETDYFIVKQRGAACFVVARQSSPTVHLVGKLTDTEPSVDGEIRITGSIPGDTPVTKPISKFTKKMVYDFSGVRYKWKLVPIEGSPDPIGNTIELTAI